MAAAILILPLSLRAVGEEDKPTQPVVPEAAANEAESAAAEQDAAGSAQGAVGDSAAAAESADAATSAEDVASDVAATGKPKTEETVTTVQPARIRPGTLLTIRIFPVVKGNPIGDSTIVDPQGRVALGPLFGRVKLDGMTIDEAETALIKHINSLQVMTDPRVQVTYLGNPDAPRKELPGTADNPFAASPAGASQPGMQPRRVLVPPNPYHIAAGDVLFVSAIAGDVGATVIDNDFVVEPSGLVALGPQFGRVKIGGLSLEDAEKAVAAHLKEILRDPKVQITVGGWRNGATKPSATADRRPPSSIRFPWEQPSPVGKTPLLASTTAQVELPLRQTGSEELAALREHVTFLEDHFKKADALFRSSARGGSASSHASSAYELALAKGELALAEGNGDEAVRHFEAAEKWANDAFVATNAAHGADMLSDDLLQVARNLFEIRRRLDRLRRPPQPAEPRQSRESGSIEKKYPDYNIMAPAPGVTESMGVLKKIVQRAEQEYKRMKELAESNAVSSSEVARALSEYEISVERLKQAERALRFYRVQVEMAKAKYQALLDADKRAPGAVPSFDLRRAKLELEMAEAKLEELAQ